MSRLVLANITATGWALAVIVLLSIAAIMLRTAPLVREWANGDDKVVERTMRLEVFFSNSKLDPQGSADCTLVYPVSRTVPRHPDIVRVALLELIQGPSPEESAEGYHSLFSDATADMLQSVRVSNGTAYVDFKDLRQIIPNASSSCGSQQLMHQVEQTLKQFPGVGHVVYAIDKIPQTFYDFVQLGCDWKTTTCDAANFP